MTGGINVYNIGKFVVIQMNEDTLKGVKQALEEGDVVDFGALDDDDFKIVAEFDGVGQGSIV